jgi:hypothetical protein
LRHLSTSEKAGAVVIALLVAGLATGVFVLTVAGLFWWQEVPLPRPTALFTASSVAVAVVSFLGMLWQFAAGHALPSEIWGSIERIFRDGGAQIQH